MKIDRIENGYAVCELDNGAFVEIPIAAIPKDAREGSIIFLSEKGYIIDRAAENNERKRLAKRTNSIFKDR